MARPNSLHVLSDTLAQLLGLSATPLPRPACLGLAPMHDETVDGETAAEQAERHVRAKQVCARCPAQRPCADAAKAIPRTYGGVWAGVVLSEERYRAASG